MAFDKILAGGTVYDGTGAAPRRADVALTGERIAAFCLTEAGSGSDAQAMRTNAVLSADSTHYVLNGQKIWISNAGYAGVFTVFAKVPTVIDGKPKERVTAFIVDAHAAGVSLGKIEQKMGIKAGGAAQ